MAGAKQLCDWTRDAVCTTWTINRNGWTREPVHPLAIIPRPLRPPEPIPKKSPEQLAEENRLAWGVLDRVFGGA